jgi:hypothetical protein
MAQTQHNVKVRKITTIRKKVKQINHKTTSCKSLLRILKNKLQNIIKKLNKKQVKREKSSNTLITNQYLQASVVVGPFTFFAAIQ